MARYRSARPTQCLQSCVPGGRCKCRAQPRGSPVRHQRARFYVSGALTTVVAVCSDGLCFIKIHAWICSFVVKQVGWAKSCLGWSQCRNSSGKQKRTIQVQQPQLSWTEFLNAGKQWTEWRRWARLSPWVHISDHHRKLWDAPRQSQYLGVVLLMWGWVCSQIFHRVHYLCHRLFKCLTGKTSGHGVCRCGGPGRLSSDSSFCLLWARSNSM